MEFGCCNDLGEFFHVSWFDVNDIEALILDVEIPEIDPQVVTTDEGLSVAVDGDTVDMIGMSILVRSTRHRSDDSVMMCQARKFQSGSIQEVSIRVGS